MVMLGNGDMIHRLPRILVGGNEYIYLPKSGGMMQYTAQQLQSKLVETKAELQMEVTETKSGHIGLIPGLLQGVNTLLFGRSFRRQRGRGRGRSVNRRYRRSATEATTAAPSTTGTEEPEVEMQGRGWLFGNGGQEGNGCGGVIGIVGFILGVPIIPLRTIEVHQKAKGNLCRLTISGNRKGCNEASDDKITIIGANGGTIMPAHVVSPTGATYMPPPGSPFPGAPPLLGAPGMLPQFPEAAPALGSLPGAVPAGLVPGGLVPPGYPMAQEE